MIQRLMIVALALSVCWVGGCKKQQRPQVQAPSQATEADESRDVRDAPESPAELVEDAPLTPEVAEDVTPSEPAEAEVVGDDAPVEPAEAETEVADELPAVLQFTMTTLAGDAKSLADYHGKVLLIVNTASRCGFTPQYAGLQSLHEQFADDGLAVMGFPANNFGGQEPGTDAEIATFCEANFGVTFDMFSKISVAGAGRHELYDALTAVDAAPAGAGPVRWNFEKFLIARDGTVVGHYPSGADPADPALVAAIQRELDR